MKTETTYLKHYPMPWRIWGSVIAGVHFFPARFLVPETTSPVTKAFDDATRPSNCAPHSRPSPLHSCFAEYILRYDVRLWPLGPTPQVGSAGPRWTNNNPP